MVSNVFGKHIWQTIFCIPVETSGESDIRTETRQPHISPRNPAIIVPTLSTHPTPPNISISLQNQIYFAKLYFQKQKLYPEKEAVFAEAPQPCTINLPNQTSQLSASLFSNVFWVVIPKATNMLKNYALQSPI